MPPTTAAVPIKADLYSPAEGKSGTEIFKEKQDRVHYLYNQILKLVESVIGTGITNSNELKKTAKLFLQQKNKGLPSIEVSYAARDEVLNHIKSTEGKKFIFVNTDRSDLGGTHHMVIYQNGKNLYFYDSFGRTHGKVVPELMDLDPEVYNIRDSDTDDREQRLKEDNCGARVISWAILVRYWGPSLALLV